jgi:hypothetical protein
MWPFKWSFLATFLSHSWHYKGLFLWRTASVWLFKLLFAVKLVSHSWHLKSLILLWTAFVGIFKLHFLTKFLQHSWHWNGWFFLVPFPFNFWLGFKNRFLVLVFFTSVSLKSNFSKEIFATDFAHYVILNPYPYSSITKVERKLLLILYFTAF